MQKFIIAFMLFIQFFLPFAYGRETTFNDFKHIQNNQIINSNKKFDNIISLDFKGYENAIIKLNQNQEEISAILSQNSNKTNISEYTYNKRHLSLNSYIAIENILPLKSSNTSYKLKNEICTRAP